MLQPLNIRCIVKYLFILPFFSQQNRENSSNFHLLQMEPNVEIILGRVPRFSRGT